MRIMRLGIVPSLCTILISLLLLQLPMHIIFISAADTEVKNLYKVNKNND